MKHFRLGLALFLTLLLASNWANAQFILDAEVRPRFEYRHGFQSLFPDLVDPAAFVSQRTRLNFQFNENKLEFKVSLQDIRVWGDVPQLNSADANGFSLHEAWGKYHLDSNFAIKAGRQEILYDDHRIFGNVDWAQQARSHDAALVQFDKNGFKADLGFAYNQNRESSIGNTLTVPRTYKALQYLWVHKAWKSFSASLLLLNNGLQYIDTLDPDLDETRYSQTAGTHFEYKKNKLKVSGNAFYQFGKDVVDNDLSAYLLGLDATFKASKKLSFGLGAELISGNNFGAPSGGENRAFNPFYGTNHKFNGLMDYFYVGNHLNNAGLFDAYAKVGFQFNPKADLNLAFHNFSAAADYGNKQFGNEIDLVFSYKVQKAVSIKAGYSHLFQSEGMEILKANTNGDINNWGWVMVKVSPRLFESKAK
jgi:hypothetical protein